MTDEIDTTDPLPPSVAAHAVAKFLETIKHTSDIDWRYYRIAITVDRGPNTSTVFRATADASLVKPSTS